MADFLKMDQEEKIARVTVVSRLNKYIEEKSLQNPDRKVEILLDGPLQELLSPPEDFGTVTYFNLCKLVGKHFPKKTEEEKKEQKKRKAEESGNEQAKKCAK